MIVSQHISKMFARKRRDEISSEEAKGTWNPLLFGDANPFKLPFAVEVDFYPLTPVVHL